MLHALTYSIIEHIRNELPELSDVVWKRDGISLTGRAKPFANVEQMPSDVSVLTKKRSHVQDAYRFQVGLFTRNITERSQLSERLKNALLQPNIDLLDTSQPFPPPTVGYFYCDVSGPTPIPQSSVNDATNAHRVYFDVEVTIYRKNGGNSYF